MLFTCEFISMKIISLVLFGCLILIHNSSLVPPACNVEHCLSCPDNADQCEGCEENYHFYQQQRQCQRQFGMRGTTTFQKTHTTTADEFSGPFLKVVGEYILTHDLNTLAVLKVENGVTVSMGKKEGFSLIIDSDIEIIEGEIWVVVNDLTTLIIALKVEGSQLVEKFVLPSTDQPFNRLDLTEDGNLVMSYLDIPKAEVYSLDKVNLQFVKLKEMQLDNPQTNIQSVKLCPNFNLIMTAKTENAVSLEFLYYDQEQDPPIYMNTVSYDLAESGSVQISETFWECEMLMIMKSDSSKAQLSFADSQEIGTFGSISTSSPLEKVAIGRGYIGFDFFFTKSAGLIQCYLWNDCFFFQKIKTFEGTYDGVARGAKFLALQNEDGQLEIWDWSSELLQECTCDNPTQYYNQGQYTCSDCSTQIENCEKCDFNDVSDLVCTGCRPGFSFGAEGKCESSSPGLKFNIEVDTALNLASYERTVEKVYSKDTMMIAQVKYKGLAVHLNGQIQNIEDKFISDFDFHPASSMLVAATYSKQLLLSSLSEGNLVQGNPIDTESQALYADFNSEGYLLAGFMNGDLILYTPTSPGFSAADPIQHEGGRSEGVKLCNNGDILSIIEEGGFFSFKMYDSQGTLLQNLPQTELVKTHLSATDDCSSVVLSHTFLQQVHILHKNGQNIYYTFRELPAPEKPVGAASINADGDMIVFPLLSTASCKVYKYNACLQEFEFVDDIEASNGEPTTTTISTSSIWLGTDSGKVDAASFSFDEGTCDDYGKKVALTFTPMNAVETATRSITHLHLSGDMLLATEKYSQTELYQITESGLQSLGDPFGEDIFTSDGDINAEGKCFVLTSHNKKAYIYNQVDGIFTLNHTIQMNSQVTSVDMSSTDCSVLLGHQDGSLSLHAPSDYDTATMEVPNDGYSILQNKICSDGSVLAVMEKGGEFFLGHYDSHSNKLGDDVPFTEEHIEVYIAATNDCQTVAVAGITMSKAHILSMAADGSYTRDYEINDQHPISAVSINGDGDLVLLSRIAKDDSTVLYRYYGCQDSFIAEEPFQSGDFDEANALNDQFIVQGNEDGSISTRTYLWEVQNICPLSDAIFTDSTEIEREKEQAKKLESPILSGEIVEGRQSYEVLFIVLGFVAICTVVFFVIRTPKPKRTESQEQETCETSKQIQSNPR